ncbi:MAG: trigger factor [Candidatus Polarisedimenticolia bacterium]
MKVVVNELDNCRRGLEVEVPPEIVSRELERSFQDYARRARIPGFRQGKVPVEIVRKRFAKEVQDDVIGRMVREYALRALEENKLEPVQDPVLDRVDYESGRALTFRATFEVRPVVSVTDYHRVALSVNRREVSETMVEESLKELADRAAKLEAVEGRPVQKGDHVVGTLSCRFIRGSGKDLTNEPLFMEAGSPDNHPEFNAAILGLEAGSSRTFEVAYPDDYRAEALRGCRVSYALAIREIKKKIVPPIDDELAKELGDFATLDDLRGKVREQLGLRARAAERMEAKDKILTVLVERHVFEVPAGLVDAQLDSRLEGMAREMLSRGLDPTKADIDWSEERRKARPGAESGVRALLILEAIAAQEGIVASDEDLAQWLREEARRHGTSPGALKEELVRNARLESVRRQIVREKSLDFVVDGANITHEGK